MTALGLQGTQAGFSWRAGDRSTTRSLVRVEKVLTTDALAVLTVQHLRDLLATCVRQDVPMDAVVSVDWSGSEAEPLVALTVTVELDDVPPAQP